MMNWRGKDGKPFSATYLKTLHNQVSAIFNHAVRFYELKSNPAAKAGSVGKKEAKDMLFWTKDEYLRFADAMMDKPQSYYAFQILYWTGVRLGEPLALTPGDFDFSKGTVSINKLYQRIGREDIITEPSVVFGSSPKRKPSYIRNRPTRYLKLSPGWCQLSRRSGEAARQSWRCH